MIKEKLIKRSPVRVFEKTLDGGLGIGNLGVIAGRKGVGKTAGLVHIATDKLMRGQNVLHISFADDPKHLVNWYEQVFREIASAYKLDDAMIIHDEIIRHRLILHFKQQSVKIEDIKKNIEQLEKGLDKNPNILIVDGFPFEKAEEDELAKWKALAEEKQLAIWFSATLHRDNLEMDENGIPAPVNKFASLFEVIIMLRPVRDYIEFDLLKSHENSKEKRLALKLDPITMLISNHRV
jgi:archaellum biogenesis ATPase FlaH